MLIQCSGRACPEGIPLGLDNVAVRFIVKAQLTPCHLIDVVRGL